MYLATLGERVAHSFLACVLSVIRQRSEAKARCCDETGVGSAGCLCAAPNAGWATCFGPQHCSASKGLLRSGAMHTWVWYRGVCAHITINTLCLCVAARSESTQYSKRFCNIYYERSVTQTSLGRNHAFTQQFKMTKLPHIILFQTFMKTNYVYIRLAGGQNRKLEIGQFCIAQNELTISLDVLSPPSLWSHQVIPKYWTFTLLLGTAGICIALSNHACFLTLHILR